MAKINYNNKSIGDQFTANDANEIKTSVNDLYDHVDDVEISSKDASNIDSGTLDDARLSSNIIKSADLQSALIAIVSANSGSGPTDGQAIIYQTSSGNLIWGSGGSSTAGQPFGLLLALTRAA